MERQAPEHLPNLPGIYIFKDAKNTVLYIGKAKSLKKRVASYFVKQHDDWKVKALIAEHATVEYIVTHSETDALLLEAQLIKQHQPKFNTLLKSGDPFLYLFFSQEAVPTLSIVRCEEPRSKHRGIFDVEAESVRGKHRRIRPATLKKTKGTYFGPFIHRQQTRKAYDYLMRTFKLYRCNKQIPNGCLDFHLGKCAGTCTKTFDNAGYLGRIELAKQALEGNAKAFFTTIDEQIKLYNAHCEFEKARHIHEYTQNFESIFATLKAHFTEQKYTKEVAHLLLDPLKNDIKNIDHANALATLQELLNLPTPIHTIDCFDISHFQSTSIVGSCVRFTDGKPEKNKFRRFKIKTLTEQNDYAALQEIVKRRYKNPADIPDLILIDGGKGQLSAAQAALPQATMASLAKKEEILFASRLQHPVHLDIQTPQGRLLIALRDYAHHFAISYHKLLRGKEYHDARTKDKSRIRNA
jgi:excinuclease ABC subunit C